MEDCTGRIFKSTVAPVLYNAKQNQDVLCVCISSNVLVISYTR